MILRNHSSHLAVLLAIALQHGALFGIKTAEDLAKYDLSDGRPIPLRWKDKYLNKPVLRNVTADGPQDVPLTKERFCEILRGRVTAAPGYSESLTYAAYKCQIIPFKIHILRPQ